MAGVWRVVLAGLLGLAALPGRCQMVHAEGPLPSFEVATVKPWRPAARPLAPDGSVLAPKVVKVAPLGDGGTVAQRVHFIGQVSLLIAAAYGVPVGSEGRMIVGGPDWVARESDRYEMQAKIEEAQYAALQKMTVPEQRRRVALMEQALLAERFGLKVHFEAREMPVYALVVAKGGAKLKAAAEGEVSRLSVEDKERVSEMTGVAVTLAQLVGSPFVKLDGDQVLDQTGLRGKYDFSLRWAPRALAEAGVASEVPEFFPAMQEQLGLRLVPSRGRVEVVVIDRVERPSGN